jgi:predicted TIM-barrel fold metal-dependent hydrolase
MSKNAFRIIDTDIHNTYADATEVTKFLPKHWLGKIQLPGQTFSPSPARGGSRDDAKTPGGGAPGSDPAYLLQHHFDAYDIDYGILTGSGVLAVSIHCDPDYGNDLASAYNEFTVEKWLDFSEKFYGCIVINHSDPIAAAKEIDRHGANPRFVQVIMASASRTLFGQRQFHPIYEAAQRHGLPIAIHPGTEGRGTAGYPTPSGPITRYMEWHNILPINYMAHVNSLVCEGVFEKFPELQFVCIEGGIAWLPHLMWRMDKNFKALRASTPWLKKMPSEYILNHIKLTTQPIEEPDNPKHLSQIFEMICAEKTVMFASDYPHWDFDNPHAALPPLADELKQRIYYDTAAELYNLPPRAEATAL